MAKPFVNKRIMNKYSESTFDWNYWFHLYISHFSQLAWSMFEWKNVPSTVNTMYLERTLVNDGPVAWYQNPINEEFFVVRGAGTGGIDLYDNFMQFQPTPIGGQAYYDPDEDYKMQINNLDIKTEDNNLLDIVIPETQPNTSLLNPHHNDGFSLFQIMDVNPWGLDNLDKRKCVVITNEPYSSMSASNMSNSFTDQGTGGSLRKAIYGIAKNLADIERNMHIAREKLLNPYLLEVDQDQLSSAMNVMAQIRSGDPVIMINRNTDDTSISIAEAIRVLDTKVPYNINNLEDHHNYYMNLGYMLIGRNYSPIDKKERVNVAEVTSNNDALNGIREAMLLSRRQQVERINACWNLDVSVDFRQSYELTGDKKNLGLYENRPLTENQEREEGL